MNGIDLLDTNIVIALFEHDENVRKKILETPEVFCCSNVLGELFYGAYNSIRVEANISRINEFSRQSSVLSAKKITAQYYGKIKKNLREKGHPIPENDIWIAALAEQHQLVVVTRDEHFTEVESIRTENW